MEHLAVLYPEHVSLYELGHSAEGREMLAMHIHGGPNEESEGFGAKRKSRRPEGKRGFVIIGAQHAREVSKYHILCHFFPDSWCFTAGILSSIRTSDLDSGPTVPLRCSLLCKP